MPGMKRITLATLSFLGFDHASSVLKSAGSYFQISVGWSKAVWGVVIPLLGIWGLASLVSSGVLRWWVGIVSTVYVIGSWVLGAVEEQYPNQNTGGRAGPAGPASGAFRCLAWTGVIFLLFLRCVFEPGRCLGQADPLYQQWSARLLPQAKVNLQQSSPPTLFSSALFFSFS